MWYYVKTRKVLLLPVVTIGYLSNMRATCPHLCFHAGEMSKCRKIDGQVKSQSLRFFDDDNSMSCNAKKGVLDFLRILQG